MYGSAHHRVSSQTGEIASLSAQANAIQARTGRLAPYTSFVSMADQRTQTVSQLVQARFDWSHALHELGRVLPSGTALSSLHGTVGPAGQSSESSTAATAATSATPASSTPPGSTPVFTLTGCATSQSEVAQTLQRLRLMDGASEVQLQSSTKSGASGSSSSSGSCPGGDPTFSAQVTFTGLPTAPAPSVTGTSASPVAARGGGSTEPVSAQGNGAAR
jgi:Tfp pilus assembly protein PilN